MNRLDGFNICAAFLKRVGVKFMIGLLGLLSIWGCEPDDDLYVRVVLRGDAPPVFEMSGDQDFKTPGRVNGLRVYRRGHGSADERRYWTLREINEIKVREIIYGVAPEGLRELDVARPLDPHLEYCVEVAGIFSETVIECFTYEP